jgi:transcriptional regulator with XRE-family HTH domain
METTVLRPPRKKRVHDRTPLGRRVRELRKQAGLTLQMLSEATGLAQSSLSKIENSQMSPTYEAIVSLAQGLCIDVAQLFDDGGKSLPLGRRSITRSGLGATHETEQYIYQMLHTDLSQRRLISLKTIIKARSLEEFDRPLAHSGEEFIYVLSGSLKVHLEHYEPFDLAEGDSCYFDSTMAHACVSTSEVDAEVLWVCTNSGPDQR